MIAYFVASGGGGAASVLSAAPVSSGGMIPDREASSARQRLERRAPGFDGPQELIEFCAVGFGHRRQRSSVARIFAASISFTSRTRTGTIASGVRLGPQMSVDQHQASFGRLAGQKRVGITYFGEDRPQGVVLRPAGCVRQFFGFGCNCDAGTRRSSLIRSRIFH